MDRLKNGDTARQSERIEKIAVDDIDKIYETNDGRITVITFKDLNRKPIRSGPKGELIPLEIKRYIESDRRKRVWNIFWF